jgi:ParB-like chromosome segregation protein Spo0J
MGKLTRRVKFIAQERRLSIPAEFLHLHDIERGEEIVVSSLDERLYAFAPPLWARYREVAEHLREWFPGQEHPFLALAGRAALVRLGSQDRVVLPRDFPYSAEEASRLHWELVHGILVMEPEMAAVPERPALSAPLGQASLFDLMPARPAPEGRFDRARCEETRIEQISVARIDWRDLRWAEGGVATLPTDALLRSLKVEGVRRPIVLREKDGGGFQVLDGFRRLAAARQLKMRTVPAIVWRGIDDAACEKLKLMEGPRVPAEDSSAVQRLQSTLRLHEDQVALREIESITGRRKRTLQRYLRVANDERVREAIETGRLSIFKAEEILKAGLDPQTVMKDGLTVQEIRDAAKKTGYRRPRREHGGPLDV